jgi:hypothetical protein
MYILSGVFALLELAALPRAVGAVENTDSVYKSI